MQHEELTRSIIGCAMKVHSTLGHGFLESVYQNALTHELRKAGHGVECERPLTVTYDGVVVGVFVADMLVDGIVIIENKAVQSFTTAHEAQLVSYLTSTGIDVGLLINFGAPRLEFRRKHRVFKPPDQPRPASPRRTPKDYHPVHPDHPAILSKKSA